MVILVKKFLSFLFLCGLLLLTCVYKDNITDYILMKYVNEKMIVVYENNQYAKSNTINYQATDNFYPKSKEDITNIFFTALNGGWNDVTFFCTKNYKNCLADVEDLASNSITFTKINNYVHPFNSYKRIVLNYNSLGKVTISIERLYDNNDITLINEKVNEIINEYITDDMNEREKIKVIHDYIINNTKYDEESAEKVKNNVKEYDFISHKATGALINGKAICGGYSDAMAVFLNKLNITNYKLTSDMHVWNYVLLNNKWLHLDLTWDDPVTNTKEDMIIYTFFLVTDEELKKLDTNEHNYY